MPFLVAFIISLIIEPQIKYIMKKTKMNRRTSSIIIFLFVSIIILGLLSWIIITLFAESSSLLQGLNDYFDAISDGTNIARSKPDPEVFQKAAEMLDETPESCLVVEDAMAGIEAACKGNFQSAGIGEAAKHSNVTYPIRTFSDLLKLCPALQ